MKTRIAAALLSLTTLTGIAVAAQMPVTKPMKGDANGDGSVSRAEFLAAAQARFARLDTDRNGAISGDERRAARADRGPRHGKHGRRGGMGGPFEASGQDGPPPRATGRGLARIDTDGDGKLSRAEFAAQSAARFARMDANGDGTVDKTEMAASPGGGRGLARIDADGNGTLTKAEFDAQTGQRFARIDTNGDGVIDAAEQSAVGKAMRGGRGRGAMPATTPTPSPAPTGA